MTAEKLAELLAPLGDTPDTIAERLAEMGCASMRPQLGSCGNCESSLFWGFA